MPDRILGAIGATMVAAAVLLLLFGGAGDGSTATEGAPPLALVSPADGAVVGAPLEVTFTAPAQLAWSAGGWGTRSFHVHADLDGRELMPGPDDIEPLGADVYRWSIRGAEPGTRTLRLFWSDAQHLPLSDSATPPIQITIR